MAASLGSFPHGWNVNTSNVAQARASAPAPAPAPTPATAQAPPSLAPGPLEAREGPAPAQWQAVKDEIRVLYEKNPLRDVRKIMERKYGFRATERMYKARLSQWGISKNYSDKDYQICSVLNHYRQKSGKRSTAFMIHGHKRSLKDLHKYVKGRKMTEEDFLASALANVDCKGGDQHQQPEQYAHVRAYTPEPEVEADDTPSASSAPAKVRPADIIANINLSLNANISAAESSPTGTASDSVAASGSALHSTAPTSTSMSISALPSSSAFTTIHHGSPTLQQKARSPRATASPSFPLMLATQMTPSTQQQQHHLGQGSRFASKESNVTWPPQPNSPHSSRGGYLVSSPQGTPSSYTFSATHEPPVPFEDQVRHASSFYDSSSPTMPCRRLGRDVEFMALQVIDAPPLRSLCGHDDIRAWSLMMTDSSSRTSSASSDGDSMDYEQICPTCHESTREHFISLPNLEMAPAPARNILNVTHDFAEPQPAMAMALPTSSRGHDHSWRWVARCFAACIYLRRGNHALSRHSLADADAEFERMLAPRQDPKVLLALNQTVQILQMHDQGDLTKTIITSAYHVAMRTLGPQDPVTTMARWMVYVADGQMRHRDITSTTLRALHDTFVRRHGADDPRAIASLYCYGFMLNVEAQPQRAEHVLREVYEVSARVLGPRHLQSISALTNLHRALHRQDRLDEAVDVLQHAIRDSKDTLGENHPRRLESMRLLALLYKQQGRLDWTEQLYWQVLEGRVKMLGKNHAYTQGIKIDLETLLKEMGKWTVRRRSRRSRSRSTSLNRTRSASRGRNRTTVRAAGLTARSGRDDGLVQEEGAEVETESEAQLRIQDIFEWDPHEQWDETRSEGGDSDGTGSQHEAF
ncbi:hypothetical protein A1O7_05888 [Cladophialophora yegresii CBS 114405]|uniref:Clr5 domain-containing protein n=1 Tax=Cladophialophora yegresii CBS 114405 TaxID=1182544 RepID=W9VSD3_9EURO|nr:uncharacterized protein A1O7_05888 [Cladophialophora yegresii CBS 114405]EXJ58463.1 hypothetical protein A1O7_05888 [Cladophialophora yegresii CBS 114405]